MNANARGAAFMVASMACFVGNDAVMKTLADELTWYQALALRGPFAISLALLLCLALDGRKAVANLAGQARNGPTALRIASEIGATSFFLLALFSMQLADVAAVTQILPLLIVLGGAVFFGEQVGPRRWTASFVGFFGVLLIIQPGTSAFDWAALYAVASAICMAVRDLATKVVPKSIPSTTITLLTHVAVFLYAGALTVWAGLPDYDPSTVPRLVASATLITFGFLLLVLGTRIGEGSFVAPFRYSILLWALAAGFIVFGEVPGPLKLLGAAIVALSGLYTFFRERQVAAAGGCDNPLPKPSRRFTRLP